MEKVGESPFEGEASFPFLSPPSLLPAHCPTNPSCVAQALGWPPQGSAPLTINPGENALPPSPWPSRHLRAELVLGLKAH